jgi:hypothetical protein
MKRLDHRQQRAWALFYKAFEAAEGHSGGVTSGYGEYSDCGSGSHEKVPKAFTSQSLKQIEHIFRTYLTRSESKLLYDLLQDYLRCSGNLTLEAIGLIRSGYKDDGDARASGVTHVQNLMTRLADYYGV